MQYMVNLLTVSDLSPSKVTSQKIFFSDDLNPDLDPVQEIARVFSETSKFFTPLQCDLEPEIGLETEINKPTSRKIIVSSNFSPDPSADLASRKMFVPSDLAPDPSAGLDFKGIIAQDRGSSPDYINFSYSIFSSQFFPTIWNYA